MRLLPTLLLCLASYSPLALATQLDDLYQVREPLAADTDVEQSIALSAAFDTLLLRLTPNPRINSDTALTALRQNPQPLIVRYSKQGSSLLVEFDPASTLRTLREQGLPLWTGERPQLLVWWLENGYGEGSAQLLGDAQSASEALNKAAQHRALPVLLPLADLSEQWLSPQTDEAAWLENAARYNSDGLLLVNATDNGRQLEASWQLRLDDYQASDTIRGMDRDSLADMLLLSVSQRLAERFAVAPVEGEPVLILEVRGANLERYAALSRVLAPFSAKLLQVDADKWLWQLSADPTTLRAHLKLMQLNEIPPFDPADAGRLIFSW